MWLVVLIVFFYHPSKNGMMLPNASINFGVRNSTPNLIHADGSRSTTNQSLPFSLPIFPGPSPDEVNGHGDSPLHLACRLGPSGTICKKIFCQKNHPITQVWPAPSLTPVVLKKRHSWPRVSGMKPCCTSGRRHSRAVTRRVRLALRVGLVWRSFVHQWGNTRKLQFIGENDNQEIPWDTLLASPCGNS